MVDCQDCQTLTDYVYRWIVVFTVQMDRSGGKGGGSVETNIRRKTGQKCKRKTGKKMQKRDTKTKPTEFARQMVWAKENADI